MYSSTTRLGLTTCLVLAVFAAPARLSAQEPSAKGVYNKAMRSVCLVKTHSGIGTAWLVDEFDRFLITNAHVVGRLRYVEVVFPVTRGTLVQEAGYYLRSAPRYRARVLDVSARDNLALLQLTTLPAGTQELKLAAVSPGPGDRVHSVGNLNTTDPLWIYAAGTVRSVYQKKWTVARGADVLALDTRVIETQAPTNLGDSGGPLLNDAGELVGVALGGDANEKAVSRFLDAARVRAFLAQSRWTSLPLNPEEFRERGRRHLDRGCTEAALADLNHAIKRAPKAAWGYALRAAVHLDLREARKALADAEKAVELDYWLPLAHFNCGRAHIELGKYDEAVEDYTRALKQQPRWANALLNRGAAHSRAGRPQEALRDYDEAIRLDPGFLMAYSNRASVLIELKEYARAIADADRAIQAGYHKATMLGQRARAQMALNQIDEALKDLADALVLEPRDPWLLTTAGVALVRKGDRDGALKAYNKALEVDPQFAQAYFNRATLYESMDRPAQAQEDYERAGQLNPAYEKRAPLQYERVLRVVNKSNRTVRVYLRCESKTKDGSWFWYYSGANEGPAAWVIQPWGYADLKDGTWRVKGRRVRIWASAVDGTASWPEREVMLVQTPYRAQQPGLFTYTLNLNN